MAITVYQPVLFVGLGGTGCDIGAIVERRLRAEICGPDGTDFLRQRAQTGMLPYQLPSCVQFVYADMNQAELDRMPRRVVPGSQHVPAARATAHYVRDLVPLADSYPQLALSLRLGAERETVSWLPPKNGEPRINPLTRGAGQFPTVGRAALFGTFMGGIDPAVRDLREAIGRLATSGEDLAALGGRPARAVDVFVAFSLAGGTGAGIFYDYLHLIGRMFDTSQLRAKVYPLVLMPSAFREGLGGGRNAELNAGRALLDLFRLVDHQNAGDVDQNRRGHQDREPINPYEQAVYYPKTGRIALRPGTVQTGFLFSQPVGAEREDLQRSIASLVLSLVGTLQQDEDLSGEPYQSFADWWVNAGSNRQVPAESGIGNRGVSTVLVASLTVPFDELSGIIGGRLLRTAIEQLSTPIGKPESNRSQMEDFLRAAGVHQVLARDGVPFAEPEPAHGAREVVAALNDRGESMKAALTALQAKLRRDVPQLVDSFDPRAAIRELLGRLDAFRVQRIAFGHPDLADEIDRSGAAGLLQRHRVASPMPEERRAMPPAVPRLRDRLSGLRRLKWSDREPTAVREQQNAWYQWRTQVAWTEAWDVHKSQWQRSLSDAESELGGLAKALLDFAQRDEERFGPRAAELYRRRVGVSYLLPPGGTEMEQFYHLVIRRLIDSLVSDGRLQSAATESDLVQALVGATGWREAYKTSFDQSADQAVADLRDLVKARVMTFLRDIAPGRRPLLPRLGDLLAEAVAQNMAETPPQDYVDGFRGKLAGLVPATFTPQGRGSMKVLISYPANARNPVIEAYLMESINLPIGPGIAYDMRNTLAESISVVLFRTSMGVTEVKEVRDLLRRWASALARSEPPDFLRWRQRTGYEFGYLATTEEHRVEILHRLLNALWNGKVHAEGNLESPARIRVELAGGVTMILQLTPLEQASSWGSLLRAYELWTFDDLDLHREFCSELMRELPTGLDGRYAHPDSLYLTVRDLAEREISRLDAMMKDLPAGNRGRAAQLRGFWAETLPAALDREFTGMESPPRPNLRQLELAVPDGGDR
jgi:Tubulin like